MREKETYIIGIYKEKEGMRSIEWIVNGQKAKLPPDLVNWIAHDYINELIAKDL